uniref:Uncharacterized protein n=1 Tax=viral metagenome TaxID=1070528 RepID=A0A6M3JNP4_9ZZZZ
MTKKETFNYVMLQKMSTVVFLKTLNKILHGESRYKTTKGDYLSFERIDYEMDKR